MPFGHQSAGSSRRSRAVAEPRAVSALCRAATSPRRAATASTRVPVFSNASTSTETSRSTRPRLCVWRMRTSASRAVGEGGEADRPPDPGRHQLRAPVPAVVALALADPVSALDPVRPDPRVVQIADRLLRLDHGIRRAEADADPVLPLRQAPSHVELPATEHVVGAADDAVVEPDFGDGVEPVALQQDPVRRQELRVRREGARVDPVGLADPLQPGLVVAVERVLEGAGREQVGMNAPGHARGDLSAAVPTGQGPVAAQVHDTHRCRFYMPPAAPATCAQAPAPGPTATTRTAAASRGSSRRARRPSARSPRG